MTQIEQIKAEIERLYCEEAEKYDTSQEIGAKRILDELSKYLNTLPAEQPSEDLEEAASRYAKEEYSHKSPATLPDRCIGCYAPLMYAFKDGANWQKEQMMQSAVDATCDLLPPPDVFKVLICHEATDKLAIGQKVKVIVKEDEQ